MEIVRRIPICKIKEYLCGTTICDNVIFRDFQIDSITYPNFDAVFYFVNSEHIDFLDSVDQCHIDSVSKVH